MNWAIDCDGLTRDFGSKRAVWDLGLKVPTGCVYGLLGRNGSGKSTTLKMLLGMLPPTRGACRLLGEDSAALSPATRRRVGYLLEGHPLWRTWRVSQLRDLVRPHHSAWNDRLFDETLERFEIDPSRRVWTLSRGQRGMVNLALVLAPEPELLIMDDPALGLDPVVRRRFLEMMIQVLHREGRTVLFASHNLADVERVADRVGILENGVLRVDCRTDEFLEGVRRVEFAGSPPPELGTFPGLLEVEAKGDRTVLSVAAFDDEKRRQLSALLPQGYEEVPLSLEDAFVAYAGRRPSQVRPAVPVTKGA